MDAEIDRADRLLRFLARRAHLLEATSPPQSPTVIHLARVPEHPVVRLASRDIHAAVDDTLVLSVGPVATQQRPALPPLLQPWVGGDPDRPGARLRLRLRAATLPSSASRSRLTHHHGPAERLAQRPDVRAGFADWHRDWLAWSEAEVLARPARELRDRLLQAHVATGSEGDGRELVLGVGLLDDEESDPTSANAAGLRFAAMVPLVTDIDEAGWITVRLDPHRRPSASQPDSILQAASDTVDGGGSAHQAPSVLVLRPRRSPAAEQCRRVADHIRDSGVVPGGLRPMVEDSPTPSTTRGVDAHAVSGHLLDAAGLRVLAEADTHAQTVVHAGSMADGTRVAAALVTHLLAEGRRVLVTAPTSAPLNGLRARVPQALRPLVCATSNPDAPEASGAPDALATAVDHITRMFGEHDRASACEQVTQWRTKIAELVQERQMLIEQAVASRGRETLTHNLFGESGTPAEFARRHRDGAQASSWLADLMTIPTTMELPFAADLPSRALELLRTPGLQEAASGFHGRFPDREELPLPTDFAALVAEFDAAAALVQGYPDRSTDPDVVALIETDADLRAGLSQLLDVVADEIRTAHRFPGGWMDRALADLRRPSPGAWHEGVARLTDLVEVATARVEALTASVVLLTDVPDVAARVRYLRDHVESTGPLVVGEHGIPHCGPQSPDAVRAAEPVFRGVRVDGRPPVTLPHLDAVLAHLAADEALDTLDRAWPDDTVIPDDTSPRTRLAWHTVQLHHFTRVVDLPAHLATCTQHLAEAGITPPDWADDAALARLRDRLRAAEAAVQATVAAGPLADLIERLRRESETPGAADAMVTLHAAAAALDVDAYRLAWRDLDALDAARDGLAELADVLGPLEEHAPALVTALLDDAGDPDWPERLGHFDSVWTWCRLDAWLEDARSEDPNAFTAEISRVDAEIRHLAAAADQMSAWNHAVAPEHLDAQVRVDLMLHSHLMRRLAGQEGSARQKAALRRVRDRCRPAVPARFVPLDRVEEQVGDAAVFDVLVVIDAQDVSVDATWLRAMAQRVVLIGDTHAATAPEPDPISRDTSTRLRLLAERYLAHDTHRDVLCDPRGSMLADAVARCPGGADVDLDLGPWVDAPDTSDTATDQGGREATNGDADLDVCTALTRAGLRVTTNVPVLGRVIHLVGEDADRVALIVETDTWTGPGDYVRSLAHQQALEHRGWTVLRVRSSEFALEPDRAVALVRRHLDRSRSRRSVRRPTTERDGSPSPEPPAEQQKQDSRPTEGPTPGRVRATRGRRVAGRSRTTGARPL